ncbi:MAG: tetratricopeptide repeat protein [Taibaiella sp.]|nr:tetratricopeptide repeat protein [Taibaiella sp.]
MSYLKYIALIIVIALAPAAYGQTNKLLKEGNNLYREKDYRAASEHYVHALKNDTANTVAMYNLGNTLYQQKSYDTARSLLGAAALHTNDKNDQSKAYYNIGNTYMQQQKWEEAANAYKQALRKNAEDADAKYNLSYAEKKLAVPPPDKNKKNDKNKDKKDQNSDQQNKDKKNKDQQNKDKQNKDQQNKQGNKDQKDQEQHPQGQPSKLSQQQADQLLNALQQEEKKLQGKKEKQKGTPVRLQKDW